jgi:dTDP-4-dehydrorhamnose 3,5-epimerase-like enzyme
MSDKKKAELVKGGRHEDERGIITFFNQLSLEPVKRFYFIEHPDVSFIRAWQGHKKESKWVKIISGSFKVILVQPDNWETPSADLEFQEYILKENENQVLFIPGGYATGFQALEVSSKMMILSDFSTKESMEDDFRFDAKMWYNW